MPTISTYFYYRWMWIQFPFVALANCGLRFLQVRHREAGGSVVYHSNWETCCTTTRLPRPATALQLLRLCRLQLPIVRGLTPWMAVVVARRQGIEVQTRKLIENPRLAGHLLDGTASKPKVGRAARHAQLPVLHDRVEADCSMQGRAPCSDESSW